MATFARVVTFTGLNGAGKISSVSLAANETIQSITNLTTLSAATVVSAPGLTVGFFNASVPGSVAPGIWQFDVSNLSATSFLAVICTP
jgi:hypothetical protein